MVVNNFLIYLMTILQKVDLNNNIAHRNVNLPKTALKLLSVLDELEDHTVMIRKKITEEIRSTSKFIHVKLDSI